MLHLDRKTGQAVTLVGIGRVVILGVAADGVVRLGFDIDPRVRIERATTVALKDARPRRAVLGLLAALLLLGSGCAATPPPRLPTWIEAAHFAPASEAIPPGLPVAAGWVVHPHTVIHAGTTPHGLTNDAGALISWTGMIRFDGTLGFYRIEYLASEFGPHFYPLFDIEHTGGATETFVPIVWTQPFPFEPRLLRKETP